MSTAHLKVSVYHAHHIETRISEAYERDGEKLEKPMPKGQRWPSCREVSCSSFELSQASRESFQQVLESPCG